MKRYYPFNTYFTALLVVLALSSCVIGKQDSNLPVAEPLAINVSVKQGLPVYFRYSMYRHIDQMPSDASMISEGKAGQPVAFLDHQFQGNVFDSQREQGVGLFLTGYLKMEIPGKYLFKAMSNDGIRVLVNGTIVAFDPTVHSDRFSEVGEVTIKNPGWYPLTVKYFQRKGTARLSLYWQPPGSQGFVPVPAGAYGH
jgi:PA14 domain-containing protein